MGILSYLHQFLITFYSTSVDGVIMINRDAQGKGPQDNKEEFDSLDKTSEGESFSELHVTKSKWMNFKHSEDGDSDHYYYDEQDPEDEQ